MKNPVHWLLAGAVLALPLAGCASRPSDPVAAAAFDEANDPLEPLNRKIFAFNLAANDYVLEPVAKTYRTVVPEFGRNRIRGILDNAHEPVVAANNLLEGRVQDTFGTVWRFFFNSTLGIGGMFDVAGTIGLKEKPADFGETLFTWGAPEGPYLVLPILGPSNPRDAIGMGVDGYADPLGRLASNAGYDYVNYIAFGLGGIDLYARNVDGFDDLRRNSLDFYAQLRSVMQQRRHAQLHGGTAGNPFPSDDTLYNDPATVKKP